MRTLTFGDRTISYDAGLDTLYTSDHVDTGVSSKTGDDAAERKVSVASSADSGVGDSLNDDNTEDVSDASAGERRLIRPDDSAVRQLLNFDEEEEDGYEEEDSDEDDEDTTRQEETSPDHCKHNKTDWRQSVVKDLTQQCARSPVISRSDSLDQVLTGDQGRGELSLQEISHIRRVLARAELEHTVSSDLRYDLDNGRVCGLCHVTRFGVISRSTQCQLCSVVTCSRCCDTVTRLDTETRYNIDDIPPHLLAPATQDSAHNDITASRHNCAGSAPNTPPTARRISDDDDDDCEDRFMSLPLHPPAVTSRSALPRRWSMVGWGRPENTVVCLQCKNMIKQILRTKGYNNRM